MTARRRTVAAFLAGSSLLQAGCSSLSAVLASVLLGPGDRGLMVLGGTSAAMAALVAGMGTGAALRSRLPTTPVGDPRHRLLASYTWWSVLSGLSAATLVLALSAVSAPFIDARLAGPAFLAAVVVATVAQTALTLFPDAWYAVGRFRPGGGWAAGMTAGGLVGVLLAGAVGGTATTLLAGQGLGMLTVAVLQAAHLRSVGLLVFGRADRAQLGHLLRAGVQALGLTVGLTLVLRTDRYLLGAVSGTAAVGVYSVAATLSEAPRLVPAALGQILMRDVAVGAGRARLRRTWWEATGLAVAGGLVVGVAGWLLVVPVFGVAFAGARPVLLVLLVAEVVFAPFAVASRGLLGGGWMGTVGALGLLGSLTAVALYTVAIPAWGVYGAAGASVVVYAGLATTSWLLLAARLRRRAATMPSAADVPGTALAGTGRGEA